MSASAGNFQRSFCRLLSAHVFEIYCELLRAIQQFSCVHFDGSDAVSVIDQLND